SRSPLAQRSRRARRRAGRHPPDAGRRPASARDDVGFAERLPEDQRHWAAEELCWLADALARARNLDVFETALLRPVQRASDDPLAFEPLRRAAERQRRAAHRLVIEAIRSDRYASLIA